MSEQEMKNLSVLTCSVILMASSISVLSATSGGSKANSDGKTHFEQIWESVAKHNACPQWYNDAVLGIYFH